MSRWFTHIYFGIITEGGGGFRIHSQSLPLKNHMRRNVNEEQDPDFGDINSP